jgi:hypothetical protein
MGKHAVVRGEVHISNIDRQAMFNRNLNEYEAVYMEGRSDTIQLHKNTSCYYLFLLGYFTLDLGYSLVRPLQSRFGSEEYNVKKEAKDRGLEFDGEIDLEIHEIYESCNPAIRKWLPVVIILIFFCALISAFLGNKKDVYWFSLLLVALFIPFLYLGVSTSVSGDKDREKEMVDNIETKTNSREQNKILILVGDSHVNPISDALEEKGWNVVREYSEHPYPKLKRRLSKSFSFII